MYAQAYIDRQRRTPKKGTKTRRFLIVLTPIVLALAGVGLWYIFIGRFAQGNSSATGRLLTASERVRGLLRLRDTDSEESAGDTHSEHEHGAPGHAHAPRLIVKTVGGRAEHDHAHGHTHASAEDATARTAAVGGVEASAVAQPQPLASPAASPAPATTVVVAATAAGATGQAYPVPVYAEPVPRDASWVPAQRPDPAHPSAAVTGPRWEAAPRLASLNPPRGPAAYADAAQAAEVASRLVVAVGLGVHSGRTNVPAEGLPSLSLFRNLLTTLFPTAQTHFVYRLYFAFDAGDPIFDAPEWRAKVEAAVEAMRAAEEAKRWHPQGYVTGATLDHSSLLVSVHWVRCEYGGKPSWAHSDAIGAAYAEGADYAMRTNDDTDFPVKGDWADAFILDLRARTPVANLGVVGPACGAGASWILTHDFTHRTHVAVFGLHYPRSLPDWSADDWITIVYRQFGLMSRREDYHVEHHLFPSRYRETDRGTRLMHLNAELRAGADAIDAWALAAHGAHLPHTIETATCC